MVKRLGTGSYQYESVDDWPKEPIPGVASDVATDSQDRVYVAVRTAQEKDNNTGAVLVFDRDGNLLKTFGEDKLRSPTRFVDDAGGRAFPHRRLRSLGA